MDKNNVLLTNDKLRTYPGFESYSDERAEKAIVAIKKMTQVLYHLYQKDVEDENEKSSGLK